MSIKNTASKIIKLTRKYELEENISFKDAFHKACREVDKNKSKNKLKYSREEGN